MSKVQSIELFPVITIVDLQVSNLRSVCNTFYRLGADISIATTAEEVASASAIILPGVGAFARAMDTLWGRGLVEPLRRRVLDEGVPLLGLCLGMQLLADRSEEGGDHAGLGLIGGTVERLRPGGPDALVPNIGWYPVRATDGEYRDVLDGHSFYFVHSYHFVCANGGDVAATFDYDGNPVAAAVQRGHTFGCQFHPEKSQDAGLDLLDRFIARTRSH